jgi:hypothetical protein
MPIPNPDHPDETQIFSNQLDPVFYPRPITSTLDNWDEKTKIDYGFSSASTGRRPLWNVPNVALTGESVDTIRSSFATRQDNPSLANVSARIQNPTMPVPATTDPRPFKPVPNMAASIRPLASVQVNFVLQIATAQPTSPRFVIYRDGQRISQEYQQLTAGGDVRSLVSGTFLDSNPAAHQTHTYTLYCRPTNVAVTFFQLDRTFQVNDTKAQ